MALLPPMATQLRGGDRANRELYLAPSASPLIHMVIGNIGSQKGEQKLISAYCVGERGDLVLFQHLGDLLD